MFLSEDCFIVMEDIVSYGLFDFSSVFIVVIDHAVMETVFP